MSLDESRRRGGRNGSVTKDRGWQVEKGIIVPCQCGKNMDSGRYVCSACESKTVWAVDPVPLVSSMREYDPGQGGCKRCPMVRQCSTRLKLDLWVLCELPDEIDMMIAREKFGV